MNDDYWKKYQQDNKNRLRDYQRNYRALNRLKVDSYQKAWRKANPDYHKEWKLKNPEKIYKYTREKRTKRISLRRKALQRERGFLEKIDLALIDLEKFSKVDEDVETYSYTISMRRDEFDKAMILAKKYEPEIKFSEFIRAIVKKFIIDETEKNL